jgi:hypothetical protein
MELILLKHVRLCNSGGNLMFNIDQWKDLRIRTLKKTGNLHINVTMCCGSVTTFDEVKVKFVHS